MEDHRERDSQIRLRYIGKSGIRGLRHGKVYTVSLTSMYRRIWIEVDGDVIHYSSLEHLTRNWSDAGIGGAHGRL